MKVAKKFLTKNGYCHILEDKIVFTPRGFFGFMGDLTIEGHMNRVLMLFGAIAVLIFYFAYINFLQSEFFWSGLFGAIGLYLIYGILKGLNTSAHPIIDRSQITEVKFVKEVKDLTLPCFEVKFNSANRKIKKRMITLPKSSAKNKANIHNAIRIMRDEGLIE